MTEILPMVTERLNCLVCFTDALPQSKKHATNDIVTGRRHMTSRDVIGPV